MYILQYALAYGFLFSRMYKAILDDMDTDQICVKSIGAGTGIDYWGLCYAIEKLRQGNCHVAYTGVEPEDWSYQIPAREGDVVDFPEDERDFAATLRRLQENPEEPLPDVYFFAHSIKEVCVHTVPEEALEEGYEYNSLQCMAEFARTLSERITDKPVYIAVSYRFAPGVAEDEDVRRIYSDEEQLEFEKNYAEGDTSGHCREIHDTLYGTYLIHSLQTMGLRCQKVVNARNFSEYEPAANEERHFETSYFSEETAFFMNGNMREGMDRKECIYEYACGCNDLEHTFDGIIEYEGRDYTAGFISGEEWKEKYNDKFPVTGTGRLFFQIYKVSRRGGVRPEVERYQRNMTRLAYICAEALKTMPFAVSGDAGENRTMWKPLSEFHKEILARCPEELKPRLTFPYFKHRLMQDGFLDDQSQMTEKGIRFGAILQEDVIQTKDGEELQVTRWHILPFFQKIIIANIINGRYLNYLTYLEGSRRNDVALEIDAGNLLPTFMEGSDCFLNSLAGCLNRPIIKKRFETMLEDMEYLIENDGRLGLTQQGIDAGLEMPGRKIKVQERMQRRLAAFCGPTDRYTVRGI